MTQRDGNIQGQSQANIRSVAEDLTTIVSNAHSTQIDIKVPKFKNEIETNPVEFMTQMEKFSKMKNVREDRKMAFVELALEGKAGSWLNLKDNITNFNDFKIQFLEEFYSIPIRVRFKKQWIEKRCNVNSESLQNYFYEQVAQARFFIPKLSEFEVNYNIVQQYPPWVRETLSTINFGDTNIIVQALGNLDTIRAERNREEKKFGNNIQPRNNGVKVNRINAQPNQNIAHDERQHYRNKNDGQYNQRNQRYNDNGYSRFERRGRAYEQETQNFTFPDTRYPPPIQADAHQQNGNNHNNPGSSQNLN